MFKQGIELRNWMHQNPEASGQEYEITSLLQEMSLALPGVQSFRPLPTGIIFKYEPFPNQPFTLFRADLDALPVKTLEGKDQIRHVCGHDIHTAILWEWLCQCIREKVNRNLLFLFQPAEETGGGANQFLRSGIFDQWKIEKAFALHVSDAFPLGSVAIAYPSLFSASCEIDLYWLGESAHITQPEKGKDAWQACYHFQRCWNALDLLDEDIFLGIGSVHAGHTRNIIPNQAIMALTLRGKTEEAISKGLQEIKNICDNVEKQTRVIYKITLGNQYPAVSQDEKLLLAMKKNFLNTFIETSTTWAAEDFGYIAQKYPSVMCWLGCREAGKPEVGLHHLDFFPPSETISFGVQHFQRCLLL